MSFNAGSSSCIGGHSRLIFTIIWTGNGEVVALGFFENAFGSKFICAVVRDSKIPKISFSDTL
jgi:hypothetical protein